MFPLFGNSSDGTLDASKTSALLATGMPYTTATKLSSCSLSATHDTNIFQLRTGSLLAVGAGATVLLFGTAAVLLVYARKKLNLLRQQLGGVIDDRTKISSSELDRTSSTSIRNTDLLVIEPGSLWDVNYGTLNPIYQGYLRPEDTKIELGDIETATQRSEAQSQGCI